MKLVVFADIAALQKYSKDFIKHRPHFTIRTHTKDNISAWPRVAVEILSAVEDAIDLHFMRPEIVIEAAALLAPMSKWTVFWRNGDRDVYEGDDIQDAFRRAGVGAGALSAVDFYSKGNSTEYEWDAEKRNWDRIV